MAFDFPRLRENVWQVSDGAPSAFVETPDGLFEVPTDQALLFLRMRSHCTAHNSVADIARKSGLKEGDVVSLLTALDGVGLVVRPEDASGDVDVELARASFRRILSIWSEEIGRSFVGAGLASGELPKSVLIGWLLETYHYVRDFPQAIAVGAGCATGALKAVLQKYAREEVGHEVFILRTLENVGLTRREVVESTPLVSTRLIGLLMRELFAAYPCAVLLMAALVEAQEFTDEAVEELQARICDRYTLPGGALRPYFEHQAIDAGLGHARLFDDHLALFEVTRRADLDRLADGLHDLKHAFDLQSLEIRTHYAELEGKYFPRQPMTFAAL